MPSRARFIHASLFIFSLLFNFHTQARAQENTTQAGDDIIRVRTDLIAVPFYVTDSHKRRIHNLAQADFQVLDNNHPVKLDYFAASTTHVAVLFALDASGSARAYAARQSDAALNLFSRFGANSSIAVLRFNGKSELAAPFSTDANNARAAFTFEAQPNRHTAIFDAALAAVKSFDVPTTNAATRRIVILMSDGLDTASVSKATAVINEAQRRGVSFYVIHFPLYAPRDGTLQPRSFTKGFRELATQTGGNYFRVGNADTALNPRAAYDLAPVFRAIEDDLASQYVIGYYSTETAREKGIHRIEVEWSNRERRKFHIQQLRESYLLNN